jgi:UDP-GlcNAc:undecaprenyl-phosphate GlcNAc-1-phosphate transferase
LSFAWSFTIAGFLAGLVVSIGLARLAPRIGWLDQPDNGRKCHAQPTALTGGLALWAALILAQAMGWLHWPLSPIDWAGIHLMAIMGALDDRFNLRARYKALAGLAVAVLLACHFAFQLAHGIDHVAFFNLEIPTRAALTFPFLFLWFWSIPQAYNLIDGINGLSMGFGLLVLGILGLHLNVQPAFLSGALLAIFLLNFPRARHFLGDCGALMLGTLLAVLSAKALVRSDATLLVWLFAYPIMDVSLVVFIRFVNGQPLGQGDRNHFHHWMLDQLGNRVWLVTPTLLLLAFLPMLRTTELPGAQALSLGGVFALCALGLKAFLDRIQSAGQEAPSPSVRLQRKVPLAPAKSTTEPNGRHQAT